MTVSWFEREPEAYDAVRRILVERYPTLHARKIGAAVVVKGTLGVSHEGVEVDRYSLELKLPGDYPNNLPMVWEMAARIPREMDRHIYPDSGALCLGVAEELWLAMNGNFALDRMLDIPVRNFLIGNSLVELGQDWPSGDRSHGTPGVVEFYASLLGTKDELSLLRFLRSFLLGKVKGHWPCPCGSGNNLRGCHMNGMKQLSHLPREMVLTRVMMQLERLEKKAAT